MALVALRMVAEEREWRPDEPRTVRLLDVMFRALDYQISSKLFSIWLGRLGIEKARKSGRVLIAVPDDWDALEASLATISGTGNVWASSIKSPILGMACRLAGTIQEKSAGVDVDRDTFPKGSNESDPWPDASRSIRRRGGSARCDSGTSAPTPSATHLSEVDRIHNEAKDAAKMALNPSWLKPSDPATIVESLNELDDILSEAQNQDLETEWGPEAPAEAPKPDFAVVDPGPPPAPTQRPTLPPPEARDWLDEEED